jgi:hypothetical protein
VKKILVLLLSITLATAYAQPRSRDWSAVRARHLQQHGVCAVCGTAKDLQVHHIKPFSRNPDLELEPSNLVTLCVSNYWGFNCHLLIGHGGSWRYENTNVLEDIRAMKEISSPQYLRLNGTSSRDAYVSALRARVKAENSRR